MPRNLNRSFVAKQDHPHRFPKKGPDAPKWYIVDAKNQVVGRLATVLARVVSGKHKPTYTPFADAGDFVVVINADQVVLTRNKWDDKKYYTHSGYISGLKEFSAKEMKDRHPEEILRRAVWGMLNKSSLARHQVKKLKIYPTDKHPHEAQRPAALPKSAVRRTVLASQGA